MKVKITQPTVAGNARRAKGEVVDLEKKDAVYLIRINKAVPHGGEAAKTMERDSEAKAGLSTRSAAGLKGKG